MMRIGSVLVVLVALFLWLRPSPRPVTVSAAAPSPSMVPAAETVPTRVVRRTPAPIAVPGPRETPPPARREEAAEAPAPDGGFFQAPDWQALKLISNLLPSRAWDGWRCADIDDSQRRSAWARADFPDDPPLIHEGTCAEWENQPPESQG